MNLAIFLHFYQPPVQKKEVICRVAEESYIPVIEGIKKSANARITLNITGCLVQQLDKYGFHPLLADIAELVRCGKIELTGSAAYHAFLPKLPESQIIRQVRVNEEILKKYFGKDLKLRGFFPPEMAFTPGMAPIIKALGYEWVILDERGKHGQSIYHHHYVDRHGLRYAFRNRDVSYAVVSGEYRDPDELIRALKPFTKKTDGYQILALDGETFGHHRKGYERFLSRIYRDEDINLHTITELSLLPLELSEIKPQRSSWTILDRKRSRRQPFLRWTDPENEIHAMQWRLTRLACDCVQDDRSQKRLDKALFSCQYWWACAKPWWYIEMIESGAHELLHAVIDSHATAGYKRKAVDLYHDIVATAFEWMRSGKMQRLVDAEHEYLHYHKKDLAVNQ